MTFKFKDRYSGKDVVIDFALIKEIRESEDVENDLYCQLSTRHPNYRYIKGSINDMVKMIYDIGYKDGADTKAKVPYEKPKIFDRVDVEVVPDEDEPKLRGYIADKLTCCVNVNHIVKFWEESGVRITVAEDSLRQLHYFDMPIDEFKKLLASKQEEMR